MIPGGKPYVSCLLKAYYSRKINAKRQKRGIVNTKFGSPFGRGVCHVPLCFAA
jgi:hypothetical protein